MAVFEVLWGQVSLRGALALLVGAWLVSHLVSRARESLRLRKIGPRAASVPAWLPGSLDVIYRAVQATIHHRNLDIWEDFFSSTGVDARGNGSYTCELRAVSRRAIFTADPDNIKAILATQFADFGKGDIFHEEWREFLGDSIFVTDGQMWHTSRQLLRPQFIRDRISDLHCFESHLQTLFKAMANGGALRGEDQEVNMDAVNGRVMDISDLFFRYTLDVATDFLLGQDVKSLSNPEQEFAYAFNEVQRIQNIVTRAGPLFSSLLPKAHFRRCLATMDTFVYQYVRRALELSPEELAAKAGAAAAASSDPDTDPDPDAHPPPPHAKHTFLHELASYTRDPKVLRDQLVAVLLAGRDTTASALSWAIYELARHPEAAARLRAEVLAAVGPDPDRGGGGRTPTYADLKGMRYLQAVLAETLRLYPVVPFNVRFALRDTTLPRGGGPDGSRPLAVLRDTPVGYSTLIMQRRADLYPPGCPPPDQFCPERWGAAAAGGGGVSGWQPKPWQYVPFNGGPRICIGQQFALTEMGYVLTRMFQRFDRVESFMHEIDGGNPTLKAEIVLQPGDGVKVAFWEAKTG